MNENMNDKDLKEMLKGIMSFMENSEEMKKKVGLMREIENKLREDDDLSLLCFKKGINKDDAVNYISAAICATITLLEEDIFAPLAEYCEIFPMSRLDNEQKASLLNLAISKSLEYAKRPDFEKVLEKVDKEKTANSANLNNLERSPYEEENVVIAIRALVHPVTGEIVDAIPYKLEGKELKLLDFDTVDKELQERILDAIKQKSEKVYKVFCEKHNVKIEKEDNDLEIKRRFFSEVFGIKFDDKGIR